MDRTYLYAPPEEYAAVQAAGAQWDSRRKCWYIAPGDDPSKFARWLGIADEDASELSITSDRAYVAAATVPCSTCHQQIEVICIYCDTGVVSGEPLTQFTVTDVVRVDEALARQLAPWPHFRPVAESSHGARRFANHCPSCGAEQDDRELHSEPGDPFFDIPRAAPGSIRLTPLSGQVRLSGDEHFTL